MPHSRACDASSSSCPSCASSSSSCLCPCAFPSGPCYSPAPLSQPQVRLRCLPAEPTAEGLEGRMSKRGRGAGHLSGLEGPSQLHTRITGAATCAASMQASQHASQDDFTWQRLGMCLTCSSLSFHAVLPTFFSSFFCICMPGKHAGARAAEGFQASNVSGMCAHAVWDLLIMQAHVMNPAVHTHAGSSPACSHLGQSLLRKLRLGL